MPLEFRVDTLTPTSRAERPQWTPPTAFRESGSNCVDIGLVNNMPDSALEATERQFRALLDEAADGIIIRLTLYALPDVPRGDWGRRHVSASYSDIADLWNRRLDGLIVTGAEPRTANLRDEPYWESLATLLDWAERNTHSAVWSCLAAHAALLHIDGIGRRPLSEKRFGIFECSRAMDHALAAGVPGRLHMPHSRWNDVSESALTSCGYRVLTRSDDAGVDAFIKQRRSLFVFFQGHPEYDADSLLLEYRRDVRRFLTRERETYPPMPVGCFDHDTIDRVSAFRQRAQTERHEALLADFPPLMMSRTPNAWRPTATCLYRNWLVNLCAQKERRLRAG